MAVEDVNVFVLRDISARLIVTMTPDLEAAGCQLTLSGEPASFFLRYREESWQLSFDEEDWRSPDAFGYSVSSTFVDARSVDPEEAGVEVIWVSDRTEEDVDYSWPNISDVGDVGQRILRGLTAQAIMGCDEPCLDVTEILGSVAFPPTLNRVRRVVEETEDVESSTVEIDSDTIEVQFTALGQSSTLHLTLRGGV